MMEWLQFWWPTIVLPIASGALGFIVGWHGYWLTHS